MNEFIINKRGLLMAANNKKLFVHGIDLLVIVGSLIVLMFLVGYAKPMIISPSDEKETFETSVLFEFSKADRILIDDNLEFTSPEEIYAEDSLVISLKPGTYYWKVIGTRESEIRKLTILSNVELKLRKKGEKYEVVNAGNVELDVKIYDDDVLVGNVVLGAEENSEVNGDKFVGEQNGK